MAYCRWWTLTQAAGAVEEKVQMRLPTEAEWEFAARGLGRRQYPWGNAPEPDEKRCNIGGHFNSTSAIGSFPKGATPPPDGIMDLAGNVWEWCYDWFKDDYYESSPIKNPKGPESGKIKSLRGGSWYFDRSFARCADRNRDIPDIRGDDIGFRCVRTLK